MQLLAAAVGNCLSDSLYFALRKFKQSPEPIAATAQAVVGRNEHGRLRVQRINVRLALGVPAASLEHLDRVLERFEDYCTVTASVRRTRSSSLPGTALGRPARMPSAQRSLKVL